MPISAAYCGELDEIFDDGTSNNYGEWKIKSRFALRSWDLWKYIEGPESEPPDVPAIRETVTGPDASGQIITIYLEGNNAGPQQRTEEAAPWMVGNNLALAKIVRAVPSSQLHLVEDAKYAKEAWQNLCSDYQQRNSYLATRIKHQILASRCTSDMDVAQWLGDMQRLYGALYLMDNKSLDDQSFALNILVSMPHDESWSVFLSGWRAQVRQRECGPAPNPIINSTELINSIRDECWFRNRNNPDYIARFFSARVEADKKKAQKRSRAPDAASTSTSSSVKRPRTSSDKFCTNPHCGAPIGHTFSDCVAYGGGSQGQYGPRWRGRWNIHLPAGQRTKANNVPPTSHPAHATYMREQ